MAAIAGGLGVTTNFVITAGASVALVGPNQTRRYVLISNNDPNNYVAIAYGTNNNATIGHHRIPPGGNFEWQVRIAAERSSVSNLMPGDIAAIAAAGAPSIAVTEW